MDCKHKSNEEGTAVAVLLEDTDENQSVWVAACELLPLLCRKHTNLRHPGEVCWLHRREKSSAQKITSSQLPSLEDIYRTRCLSRARNVIKDSSHPNNHFFTLLPSGKHYQSLKRTPPDSWTIFIRAPSKNWALINRETIHYKLQVVQ